MIAQLVFGLLLACSLLGQTRVELTKQVKGALPPDKGGTGVSSCLEDEGLAWQAGEFACSALASGPHAPTHQHGGIDEVGSASPADNAIPKAGLGGRLAEGWIPTSISQDMTWTGAHDFKQINGALVSTSFDWAQTPGGNLVVGPNTVTLTPCPTGIAGANTNHYLYVSGGAGSAEAVLITGGTCTSDAPSGTIEFSATNSHSGSWQIGSATAGIQEAVWALNRNGPNGGTIMIPPGTHILYQTLSIGNGTATISSTGTASEINHVRLVGAGNGNSSEATGFPFATQLRWRGPLNGKMIVVRGPIQGVEMAHMKISGWQSSGTGAGDLLTLFFAQSGSYRNLNIGHGEDDSSGVVINAGSNSNLFKDIDVVQQVSGASGIVLGKNADGSHFGISQNVFIRCHMFIIGNKDTSYGWYFEGADNNSLYQCNSEASQVLVTGASNTTPVVITTNISNLRATGDTVRIGGVAGNTAANGTFTITVTGPSTFSLDGSSGNGTYSGGGGAGGPGHSLYFKQMAPPNGIMPLENSFYNSAFQRAFVTSDGGHGPNTFFPFTTGDGQRPPTNSSAISQISGIAHPDYAATPLDYYSRIMGKHKFVKDDNATGFAKFYTTEGEVAIGDVDALTSPSGLLELTRNNGDSQLTISTSTSGNSILQLGNNGNQAYEITGNRAGNNFKMERVGSDPFLVFFPASDLLQLTGSEIELRSNATPVTRLKVPADGGLQWQTAVEQSCDVAHRGTTNYVAAGAGVGDTFRTCRKDAAGSYAWVDLF